MNIYQAIMKAADHIEANPSQFDFFKAGYPDCNTPGCALGWIGVFIGLPRSQRSPGCFEGGGLSAPCRAIGIDDHLDFYKSLDGIDRSGNWRYDAVKCASAMREYARLHHADKKPVPRSLPADIVAIFNPSDRATA